MKYNNLVTPVIPAKEIHYRELTDVWEASVRATHYFLQEEDILFYRPLVLNTYLKALDVWCHLHTTGNICGFVGVSAGKVEMLFVHPAYRGKGIGKILLQHAVQTLQAYEVDVNEQNELAVQFYRHMGFEVASRSEFDAMEKPYPILHMKLK